MNVFRNAQRYSESVSTLLGPILVPEWGDSEEEPAEVYYRRPKVHEVETTTRLLQAEGEGFAACLILRALDADGKPMFREAQKSDLRNLESEVPLRVLNSMDINATWPENHSSEIAATNEELGN